MIEKKQKRMPREVQAGKPRRQQNSRCGERTLRRMSMHRRNPGSVSAIIVDTRRCLQRLAALRRDVLCVQQRLLLGLGNGKDANI